MEKNDRSRACCLKVTQSSMSHGECASSVIRSNRQLNDDEDET